jgi:hypothetical protein
MSINTFTCKLVDIPQLIFWGELSNFGEELPPPPPVDRTLAFKPGFESTSGPGPANASRWFE